MRDSLTLLAALAVLGLAGLWAPAHSIKCYVCQSKVDPKCGDPFDNLTLPLTDCDAYARADTKSRFCRKLRQKVNGEWRTIRDCGYLNLEGPKEHELAAVETSHCTIKYGNYDIFVESCICNYKDGCNSN